MPPDFGRPEGTWKCFSVLPALLSSSYKRLLQGLSCEVAPSWLVFWGATRGAMLVEASPAASAHSVWGVPCLCHWTPLTVQGLWLVLGCAWAHHLTNNQDSYQLVLSLFFWTEALTYSGSVLRARTLCQQSWFRLFLFFCCSFTDLHWSKWKESNLFQYGLSWSFCIYFYVLSNIWFI